MRSKKSSFIREYLPLAFLGCFLAGSTASAQVLEEVVVTAQKREENVQDVPIAITAVTGAMLEKRGLTTVSQVAELTPNLYSDPTTPFSGSNNVLAAYIRGIGQNDFAFNLEPGVGVYIDGVYMARTIGANADLMDVERVEVLKGPQGTLFGRNTIGGAISVITRDPGNEFKYRGEVTTGSYSRLDVRGAVEGPIIEDTLYGLVAFSSKDSNGYQKVIPFPGIESANNDRSDQFLHAADDNSDRLGGEDRKNIRAKLLWDVNPDLQVRLTGAYTTTDESSPANTMLAYFDNPTPGVSFGHLYDLCISAPPAVVGAIPPCFLPRGSAKLANNQGAPIIQQPAFGSPVTGGVNFDGDPNNNRTPYRSTPDGLGTPFITDDIDETFATGPNFNKMELYDIYTHIDYDLPNDWHLKYIGSFRRLQHKGGVDADASPLAMLEVSFDTNQEQWSHELQLSGRSFDDRLDWVLGLYYFHEEGDLTDFVTFPGGFLQVFGQNFFDTDAWAAFTHLNYQLTDRWGLTFGARFTREEKEFEGRQRDLNGVAVNPGLLPGTGCLPGGAGCSTDTFPDQDDLTRFFPLGVNKRNFDDVTFRAGVEYNLTDEAMTYFSFAQGFKSGGWTTRLSAPMQTVLPCDEAAPGLACVPKGLEFDEETADTFELGFKSQLLNRRLQMNLAGFYTDYQGMQLTLQEGASPVFTNAGDVEIKGAEAELQWLATDRLTFNGSAGWTDAEYDKIDRCNDPNTGAEFACVLKTDALAGARTQLGQDVIDGQELSSSDQLVNVPEWNASIAADYLYPLAIGGTLNFHVDWVYNSSVANDVSNTPELMQGDTNFVNLAVTYTNPSDNWSLSVGGRNVTDERHLVTGQNQPAAGMIYGTYNRPAEWFVTLNIRN